MNSFHNSIENERGESLITFSLVMIPLMALMGLIITLSMLIYANIIVIDATRDGARHRALNLDTATGISTEQVIKQSIGFARLPTDGEKVTVVINEDINYVTVTTTYLQPTILPRLPELFGGSPYGNSFPVQAKITFKRERR